MASNNYSMSEKISAMIQGLYDQHPDNKTGVILIDVDFRPPEDFVEASRQVARKVIQDWRDQKELYQK